MDVPRGRYLVLGSTGLVGSHLLLRLIDSPGVEVRAVYHNKPPSIFGSNITYIQGDLSNREVCRAVVKDADYLFAFAAVLSTSPVVARSPVEPVTSTLIMTSQVLEAAYLAGVKKAIWLGSTTGYPPVRGKIREDQMFEADPPDVYYPVGWMSRYLETVCKMYSEMLKEKMVTIVLRPSMVYGEYDNFSFEMGHFFPAFIRRVVERQDPIPVTGSGRVTRDLVYAGDVAEACLFAIGRLNQFGAFNIAYGKSYPINELLKMILRADGYENAHVVHIAERHSTVPNRSFDNTKAAKILGFRAHTKIEEGIGRTLEWYKNSGLGGR